MDDFGTRGGPAPPRRVRAAGADDATGESLVERVRAADAPLVVTNDLGAAPEAAEKVASLVSFAEAAGAGVVEHCPWTMSFPRDHELHAGFDPSGAFAQADLVVLADADVPWVPRKGNPAADLPIVQIDADPTKGTYPQWPFPIEETVAADAARTLAAAAERLDPAEGEAGRAHWSAISEERRTAAAADVAEARDEGRLTPSVLSSALNDVVVDDSTTVLCDAVTSTPSITEHVRLSRPGSYFASAGSGLGWGGGAAVGVKLARPDERVVTLVGDGCYLFSHPTVTAYVAAEHDAPTLTVVYDNQGWNAVADAVRLEHPGGKSVGKDVPESHWPTKLDLTKPAEAVDSFTASVEEIGELEGTLSEAAEAVDGGKPAVVSVGIERIR